MFPLELKLQQDLSVTTTTPRTMDIDPYQAFSLVARYMFSPENFSEQAHDVLGMFWSPG